MKRYWFKNKKLQLDGVGLNCPYRINGPAAISYYNNGNIYIERWYSIYHHHSKPNYVKYHKNGNICNKHWYKNIDEVHRIGAPASISYYESGEISNEAWYENNKPHRIGAPAFIAYYKNGNIREKYWYKHGNHIREIIASCVCM
jgi:antitoxin component YwqK of YwqJK toxin-antitoxin module